MIVLAALRRSQSAAADGERRNDLRTCGRPASTPAGVWCLPPFRVVQRQRYRARCVLASRGAGIGYFPPPPRDRFFCFSYFDYRLNGNIAGTPQRFDDFLFNRSPFWSLLFVFDTLAMGVLLGVFGALDWLDIRFGMTVPLTTAIVGLVGTLQWYGVGGAIGAGVERLWSGLKGPEDEPGDEPRGWL